MLKIQLLGGFELFDPAGRSIDLPVKKDQALLAYLAMRGRRGWDRCHLADLLWHDRGREQARKSLRQSLVSLRKALTSAGDILPPDRRQTVALNSAGLAVDALAFEDLSTRNDPESLKRAAELYRGPLLPDFSINAPRFQDWLAGEQARFADLACFVFARVAEELLDQGDWDQAASTARRLIAVDPLREVGHRLLMRALDGAGRRVEALQHFHRLSGILRQELDVRPDPDTASLFHEIRRRANGTTPGTVSEPEPAGLNASIGLAERSVRPGLVVLPLKTSGVGDEVDEEIADGLTEELIGSLAAYRWFFVISALKATTYRNQSVSASQLIQDLGVRYVLAGSLRRTGTRVRLQFHLSETERGEHLWMERVDCFPDETLDAQDHLARQVARTVEPELLRYEEQIALRRPPGDFDAWGLVARSQRQAVFANEASLNRACALAREAIVMSPEDAFGHASLAWALWMTAAIVGGDQSVLEDGMQAASRAIEIDPRYFLGHMALGGFQVWRRDFDGAITSLRRTINLNPSFPVSYNQLTSCLSFAGLPHDALSYVEPLDRISPSDPFLGFYGCVRALAYFFAGNDVAAVENAKLSLAHHPVWLWSEAALIAAAHRAGMESVASDAVRNFLANHECDSIATLRESFKFERDYFVLEEQLRAAGLSAK